MSKVCTKCGIEKEESEFYVRKASPDGLMPKCKDCTKAYQRARIKTPEGRKKHNELNAKWRTSGGLAYFHSYYAINKEEMYASNRKWAEEHPEEMRAYKKKWSDKDSKENPDRIRAYAAKRRKDDIQVRIKESLRSRLNVSIKEGFKGGSAVRDLGLSIEEFKIYLEVKFHPGMTWENWGKGFGCWNIDHIIPLSAFDLTNRQHVVLACYYLNLQPLWFEDNMAKGDRLDFQCRQI